MMNNDKVREEKLQYDIDSETAKKYADLYHLVKLINMSILQVKKYLTLIQAK